MRNASLVKLVHKTIAKLETRGDIASNNYAIILSMLLLLKSNPTEHEIDTYIRQLIKMVSDET